MMWAMLEHDLSTPSNARPLPNGKKWCEVNRAAIHGKPALLSLRPVTQIMTKNSTICVQWAGYLLVEAKRFVLATYGA